MHGIAIVYIFAPQKLTWCRIFDMRHTLLYIIMKKKKTENYLGDIIQQNKLTVCRFAKAMGVTKDVMVSWVTGLSRPSDEMSKYIASWLGVPVKQIWPQVESKTDWRIVFNAVSDRIGTVNYHDEPELFARLCNKLSIASVKLYTEKRRSIIIEQDKRNENHARCLMPGDFARVAAAKKNHEYTSILLK